MDKKETDLRSYHGEAQIKAEFLLPKHSRELNTNFVAEADKKRADESQWDKEGAPLKKKLRGQNKHRPLRKQVPKSTKMCFSFGEIGTCTHGDNCRYSHDVATFLSTKPKDIGETCYLFKTFGKCPYNYSCRYGSSHIIDGKNIVNKELLNIFEGKKLIVNSLSRDLDCLLKGRQQKYDFSKSYNILKRIKSSSSAQNCVKRLGDMKNLDVELNEEAHIVPDVTVETADSVVSSLNEVKADVFVPEIEEKPSHYIDAMKSVVEETIIQLRSSEIKKVDFKNKLYLAPLTTVGNLPFRRICKEFGADITCGEMAMASSILCGQHSEWALLKRHHTEDLFGVQVCGAHADVMTKCCQLLTENTSVDFVDINLGCPLKFVYEKGSGVGLMNRMKKLGEIVEGMTSVIDVPLTMKMRTGIYANDPVAQRVIKRIMPWKDYIGLITVHGRSREQRYTKSADWNYINKCCEVADPIPLFGSGDVLSFEDYNLRRKETNVSGIMIARGALIKPWIFKEIKEQRHWDISSSERFEMLRSYANYGLEHWGSDTEGVEKTRRFLLEWLSFSYRYIPVGLLEHIPQRINERPPLYRGRDDLETLMASPSCADWIKISEMLLGPVPENFVFLPKHKANAYQ